MNLPPEVEKLIDENPQLVMIGMALLGVMVLSGSSKAPAWRKDLPAINGRTNSAWRGKGSFGKGFGPVRVQHK